jgi:hypothetical protein
MTKKDAFILFLNIKNISSLKFNFSAMAFKFDKNKIISFIKKIGKIRPIIKNNKKIIKENQMKFCEIKIKLKSLL